MIHFLHELQILVREQANHVLDESMVEAAPFGAGGDHLMDIQEQNGGRLAGDDRNLTHLLGAGERLGKAVSNPEIGNYGPVAPEIMALDVHRTAEHNAQLIGELAFIDDRIVFGELGLPRPQAGEEVGYILCLDL